MDICFAFSASAPKADETFEKMKKTFSSFIDRYREYKKIHYCLIPFGTETSGTKVFSEQFDDADKLIQHVLTTPRPDGSPDFAKALDKAKKIFDAAPVRPKAKKFLVVVVDNKSVNDPEMLKKAAKPLEEGEIKVIAVNIGSNADPRELAKILPNKGNLITADDKTHPDRLRGEIMETVLKGEAEEFHTR